MRCYICDNALKDDEIKFNKDHQEFDPCGFCLEIIRDAAYETGDDDEEREVPLEDAYEALGYDNPFDV